MFMLRINNMRNNKAAFKPPKAIRLFAKPDALFLCAVHVGLVVYFTLGYLNELKRHDTFDLKSTFLILCVYGVAAFVSYEFHKRIWDKLFASLVVKEDEIIWKCPTKKSKSILNGNIRFIGVESENAFNGLEYPFIFISSSPYPREFAHKIDKLPVTNDFLKFWYTPELATYLLSHFPGEKTGSLSRYHQNRSKK